MNNTYRLLALLLLACSMLPVHSGENNKGNFLDDLVLKDTGDGRRFQLMSQFRYTDPRDITWVVPTGEVVDGASIPSALWSIVGGPWSGKYRRASVIHDYFFRTKKYDSDAVHRVFYDAMITDGVPILKAKTMYYAVLRFNDRWEQKSYLGDCGGGKINCKPILAGEGDPTHLVRTTVKFDNVDINSAMRVIEAENLSLAQIEDLAKRRRAQAGR